MLATVTFLTFYLRMFEAWEEALASQKESGTEEGQRGAARGSFDIRGRDAQREEDNVRRQSRS